MRLKKPPRVDPDTTRVNPGRRTVTMEAVAKARTAANKVAFLQQFKIAGTITAACRAAGVNRDTHYDWLGGGAQYGTGFEEAKDVRGGVFETEARRRALVGAHKPGYQ